MKAKIIRSMQGSDLDKKLNDFLKTENIKIKHIISSAMGEVIIFYEKKLMKRN